MKTETKNAALPLTVAVAYVIPAEAATIYAIIADYCVGHPAILPKQYFKELHVEEGGVGEGTVTRLRMEIYGREFHYHHRVTEPEPGRVLVERDINTGLASSFTLEPLPDEGQGPRTRVTIRGEYRPSPGVAGAFERLMTPPIMRRIFKEELQILADYVQQQAVRAG